MQYSAHPTACIEDGAQIGANTKIWHFAHLMPGAQVGSECNLGQNVFVDNDAVVGDRCKLQNNVSVYAGVELEDEVFVGPSAVFTNVRNPRSPFPTERADYHRTLVRHGATIGANATIVCGVTIGSWAFVGAGAVVTKDVGPHALVVGTPARRVGWVCKCGQRLGEGSSCQCGEPWPSR